MPYLEPYLIDTMRQARARLSDPALIAEIDLFIGQEAAHFRQHQQFNRRLADLGYKSVPISEAALKSDYQGFACDRSFAFNLAYAEDFEAMALVIGHMLVRDRTYLFGDGEASVSSLILWHFIEEIEHKCATYDVFKALDGRYHRRIHGLLFAMAHIMGRTRQGYRALMIEDGLWSSWRSRLALCGLLLRMFVRMTPGLLLMAWGSAGPFIRLTPRWHQVFFWSAVITGWLFTVPAYFNALFGTRGLAMGGAPFKGGLANDVIFLLGWPPLLVVVHLTLALAVIGLVRSVKALPTA